MSNIKSEQSIDDSEDLSVNNDSKINIDLKIEEEQNF